jgi:hypothetical protein
VSEMRRCSLRGPHEPHAGTMAGRRFVCDGAEHAPPTRIVPTIRYVFPLGPGRPRAEMLLPEDLSAHEARRLSAMLATLPL